MQQIKYKTPLISFLQYLYKNPKDKNFEISKF